MAIHRRDGQTPQGIIGLEELPRIASSLNSHNSALKPKVNYDLSSFSPRDGSAFLGNTTTPRDVSHILDSAYKSELSHSLRATNQNLQYQLQECQLKLQNAEQRALKAELELASAQGLPFPGDTDAISEVSQISKRLPSPCPGSFNQRGMSSVRPASRNGGSEYDLRCENLVLVIEDLRARLASATQQMFHNNVSIDESDVWRITALREQLRWADNATLDQSKKKDIALSTLRDIIASCQRSILLTPQHLMPAATHTDIPFENPSDGAQKWMQRLLHVHDAVVSKVLSLENRNQMLERHCEELTKTFNLQQAAHAKFERGTVFFEDRMFTLLKLAHTDRLEESKKSITFATALNEREVARNLNSEFIRSDADFHSEKSKQTFHLLKRLIYKNKFTENILQKLAKSMQDQVSLVDALLAEFRNLVKHNCSESQTYSIQRSFQFVHQELIRLEECFHLITKEPIAESVFEENFWDA